MLLKNCCTLSGVRWLCTISHSRLVKSFLVGIAPADRAAHNVFMLIPQPWSSLLVPIDDRLCVCERNREACLANEPIGVAAHQLLDVAFNRRDPIRFVEAGSH